jgi:hypothetical protein
MFFTGLISLKLGHSVTIRGHSLYEILSEPDEKYRKYVQNLFAPLSKVCL